MSTTTTYTGCTACCASGFTPSCCASSIPNNICLTTDAGSGSLGTLFGNQKFNLFYCTSCGAITDQWSYGTGTSAGSTITESCGTWLLHTRVCQNAGKWTFAIGDQPTGGSNGLLQWFYPFSGTACTTLTTNPVAVGPNNVLTGSACWGFPATGGFNATLSFSACPLGDAAPEIQTEIPPCRHYGRELTGFERRAAGLDHVRRWALCLHPDKPLGANVCRCQGCGPTCRGYELSLR